MDKNHDGMVPQPKQQALEQAVAIKQTLHELEGHDLGFGLVYHDGALIPKFDDESSPYFTGENAQPLTFFHYRNLSTTTTPANTEFHDLMHFGSLRAAHSRAFSKRLLQKGLQFSEDASSSDIFNQCARLPVENTKDFGEEVLFSAHIQAKSPFFIPDIGQTFYFKNRAVLYACGLFEESEVDHDLFDKEGFPQDDIDLKVTMRLRDLGYDSIAYMNNIEDPDSLSLIILDKHQAIPVPSEHHSFPGVRYRFGPPEKTKIVEYNETGETRIVSDAYDHGIKGMS